jgi:MFS transporter, putative metabolite:H+ symporter
VTSVVAYWLVIHLGWRWLFFLGGVPAVLTILLRWGLPESPRWLAGVGRIEEAEKAMARIEQKVRKAFGADLPKPEPVSMPEVSEKRATLGDLFRGIYLRRTILIWSIFFSTYLANYSIAVWLPTIYKTIYKVPTDKALLYGTVIFIVGLGSTIACAFLIDKIGRVVWIAGSLCFGGIFLIILWWLGATTVAQVLVLTSASYFFITSVSLALILYAPELYPTRMRARGASVGTVWLRVASILGPLVVGTVIAHYTLSWAFLFFGIIAILGGLMTAFFGVETKGRVLEEVSP